MAAKPIINLADVPLKDGGNGKELKAKIGSFGKTIGSTGIGAMLHVLEPGQKAFPFHVHHQVHELFIILEGEGTYRFGSERFPVKAGDVCAAPTGGPDVAHQLINTGTKQLRFLGISTQAETEVVEYPDSKKFSVLSHYDWSKPDGGGGLRFIGRKGDTLDYFDGEK